MTFYIFAAIERAVNRDDHLLARRDTKQAAIRIAESLDATEAYIMSEQDNVVWQSWPDVDAAIAASEY